MTNSIAAVVVVAVRVPMMVSSRVNVPRNATENVNATAPRNATVNATATVNVPRNVTVPRNLNSNSNATATVNAPLVWTATAKRTWCVDALQ
jgi:hypothetical protein